MAPWSRDKPSRDDEQHHQNDKDPFQEFRRFADEQINALVQGINAIPGLSSQALESEQKKWTEEMQEVRRRLDEDFPDLFSQLLGSPERRHYRGGPVSEEARQAARVLLLQARNANVGTDPHKILQLYQDHGQGMVPVSGSFPIRTTTSNTTWLGIDWFRHSPYSPIQLEQNDHCHQHGSKWRAAFEDLLCAQLDKYQPAHEAWAADMSTASSAKNQALYAAWAQPGIDWMLGLQCRGILPPQLPSLYNITPLETRKLDRVFEKVVAGVSRFWTPYGKAVDADFSQLARVVAAPEVEDLVVRERVEPLTELDLYESVWQQAGKRDKTGGEKDSEKITEKTPGVVAVMTTTETRRLPDGTVHSKRVLKKKFADGSEESREEVSDSQAEPNDQPRLQSQEQGQKKKGGGWFWT